MRIYLVHKMGVISVILIFRCELGAVSKEVISCRLTGPVVSKGLFQ